MEFDLENPLKHFHDLQSDEYSSLFLVESDHMPSESYVRGLQSSDADIFIRRETIALISQSCSNFDPLLAYLAITYLDRFLSSQGILEPKPWVLRLLAVSCVSLAAKMKKSEFSLADCQSYGGLLFDAKTIKRMEMLVLGALKWRMRSITPFSFIPFFISFFEHKHPPLTQALKTRASEIIFKAQTETKLLEFKPSVISASALLAASHELFPVQYLSFRKSISRSSHINKVITRLPFSLHFLSFSQENTSSELSSRLEGCSFSALSITNLIFHTIVHLLRQDDLFRCFGAMQVAAIDGYESVWETGRSSDTPVNVLDSNFTASSESESVGERGERDGW